MCNEEDEVVEAILKVILADLNLLGEDGSTGTTLDVTEDIPILLVLLQVLMHGLNIKVRFVLDLLPHSFLHLTHRQLHSTSTEVIPLSMLKTAFTATSD